jgi:hypothetical protein
MNKKKNKKIIYEDLLNQHRPTIKSLIVEILKAKLFNLQRGKESIIRDGAMFVPEEDRLKHLPLTYIALLDNKNKVIEMIRINQETASLLLNKKIKMIPFDPKLEIVKKGMWYNKEKFYIRENDEKNS